MGTSHTPSFPSTAQLNTYQTQHNQSNQVELFENLERELRSIVDVFNHERAAKKKEIESLKMQIRDYEE
jgi:hypothetical protein